MNIWTIEGFEGYNSEKTSAIVVADNTREATYLLEKALKEQGLPHVINGHKLSKLRQGGYSVRILGDDRYKKHYQWLLNNPSHTERKQKDTVL